MQALVHLSILFTFREEIHATYFCDDFVSIISIATKYFIVRFNHLSIVILSPTIY